MLEIYGTDRLQMTIRSLDDAINATNPVRFVEAFVEKLDLDLLGFQPAKKRSEGRPNFAHKLFLKIYLYGYLNGIRSCRRLEKECIRNIELHWLTQNLQPNYHSIADFRADNSNALRSVFKLFVAFLKNEQLVLGETIAIDGTKTRASNGKKANFNQKKIDRHKAYIDQKINDYLAELDKNDAAENPIKVDKITEKIALLNANKLKYEALEKQLIASGDPQISTTDPDARALLVQGQVVEVAYNLQAAVDAKHKLIVATHTINRNDRNALTEIALEAKSNLEVENMTILADKGYHNGRQIQQCSDADIATIVAAPTLVNSNETGTTAAYMVDKFVYNNDDDTYVCPQGETLKTTGTWHPKTKENSRYLYKKYRTSACKTCPVRHLCTSRKDGGREIERSEFADAVAENNQRYQENPALYRQRQELNEHIFGTIKRQWGYYFTDLRGLEKVNGEHSLICLAYNIKRTINIVGIENLLEKLKNWTPRYARFVKKIQKIKHFKPFWEHLIFEIKLAA